VVIPISAISRSDSGLKSASLYRSSALFHVGMPVGGQYLVTLGDPGRGRGDGPGWDVDREVVPRVVDVAALLEANDRRARSRRRYERTTLGALRRPVAIP
jgi:hypothetical protein